MSATQQKARDSDQLVLLHTVKVMYDVQTVWWTFSATRHCNDLFFIINYSNAALWWVWEFLARVCGMRMHKDSVQCSK